MPASRAISLLIGLTIGTLCSGCATFYHLGQELKFMDRTVVVSGQITNADTEPNVHAVIVEWDREKQRIDGADFTEIDGLGVYGFFVEQSDHHYLCAFSDRNANRRYEAGEPAWIHSDASGRPVPLTLNSKGRANTRGTLSSKTILPADLVAAARAFVGDRSDEEVRRGWNIPISLGEIAKLDEARFSSERGSKGFWQPASYPVESGVGIFFLEQYDPNRTPVLFVYGAAGSPQDWKTFFERFDRKNFQLWFYQYPSGRRLAESGGALNRGLQLLHSYYGFDRLHVVAHSMGGLVSRYAILGNRDQGNRYIDKFVSISSPFGGAEFAKSGVRHAPAVIPSWRDMVPDSEFQQEIFKEKLKGRVDYLLIYGDRSKRSLALPKENDGSVSVKSVTRPEAVADAIEVKRYHEDHVSILSNPDVIRTVEDFLMP